MRRIIRRFARETGEIYAERLLKSEIALNLIPSNRIERRRNGMPRVFAANGGPERDGGIVFADDAREFAQNGDDLLGGKAIAAADGVFDDVGFSKVAGQFVPIGKQRAAGGLRHRFACIDGGGGIVDDDASRRVLGAIARCVGAVAAARAVALINLGRCRRRSCNGLGIAARANGARPRVGACVAAFVVFCRAIALYIFFCIRGSSLLPDS